MCPLRFLPQSFTWSPWWFQKVKAHSIVLDSVYPALQFLRALMLQQTAVVKWGKTKLFLVVNWQNIPQPLHPIERATKHFLLTSAMWSLQVKQSSIHTPKHFTLPHLIKGCPFNLTSTQSNSLLLPLLDNKITHYNPSEHKCTAHFPYYNYDKGFSSDNEDMCFLD